MNEVVKRVHEYRGYKIKYSSIKDEWEIFNNLKKPIGTSYPTIAEAKQYVDDILKE